MSLQKFYDTLVISTTKLNSNLPPLHSSKAGNRTTLYQGRRKEVYHVDTLLLAKNHGKRDEGGIAL